MAQSAGVRGRPRLGDHGRLFFALGRRWARWLRAGWFSLLSAGSRAKSTLEFRLGSMGTKLEAGKMVQTDGPGTLSKDGALRAGMAVQAGGPGTGKLGVCMAAGSSLLRYSLSASRRSKDGACASRNEAKLVAGSLPNEACRAEKNTSLWTTGVVATELSSSQVVAAVFGE